METNVKIVGFANESFNGKNISSRGFDVKYDGNIADINAFSDGKVYYTRLDNEDIKDLLSIPSSSQTLEERLTLERNPVVIKYYKRKPSLKKVRRSRHRTVRLNHKPSSKSYSRGKTTKRLRIKERKATPYKRIKTTSRIPSIERTIY